MDAHIVFVADEGYARGLAVTLQSLLDSLRSAKASAEGVSSEHASILHVWLVDTGLLDASWEMLQELVHQHNMVATGKGAWAASQQQEDMHAAAAGSSSRVASTDSRLQQHQELHGAVVELHRIPAGASVVLPRLAAGLRGSTANTAAQQCLASTLHATCTTTECSSQYTEASNPSGQTAGSQASSDSSSSSNPAMHDTYHLPPCETYASQSCWLKLLLPWLLPADIDFFLYLDFDMRVMVNPCGLLQQAGRTFEALPSTLLAAVRDFGVPYGHEGLVKLSKEGLAGNPFSSWASSSPYFNAGLLLYNTKAWRQQGLAMHSALLQLGFGVQQPVSGRGDVLAPAAEVCSEQEPCASGSGPDRNQVPGSLLRYHDQDALNLLCCARGGWEELPHTWNVQGIGTYMTDRMTDSWPHQPALFTPDIAAQLEASPAIVHFTGPPTITPAQLLNPFVKQPSKPWAYVCLNPFKDAWYEVLDRTPWGGWRPEQLAFEQAAVLELQGLCRQLSSRLKVGGCGPADPQHGVGLRGVHTPLADAPQAEIQPAVAEHTAGAAQGSRDSDTQSVNQPLGRVDPELLPGQQMDAAPIAGGDGSSGGGVAEGSTTAAGDTECGSLAHAVCGAREFDAQHLMHGIAALCLAAAASGGPSLNQ